MNSFSFGGHDDSIVCLSGQSTSGGSVVLENGSRRQSSGFRKNIRDVLDSSQLHMVTLEAQKAEFERILRMKEQQKWTPTNVDYSLIQGNTAYKLQDNEKELVVISSDDEDNSVEPEPVHNTDCVTLSSDSEPEDIIEISQNGQDYGIHTNDALNTLDAQGRVVINVGHPANEPDIFIAAQFARAMKPHQIGGIRFLYDNIIESCNRYDTSSGLGCILAHSMGLGKTMQIICFTDIFIRFTFCIIDLFLDKRYTKGRKILCIMPVNTLQNWMAEYDTWLPKTTYDTYGCTPRQFKVFVLNDSCKSLSTKLQMVREWNRVGGVLLIGYELFRLLALKKCPKAKSKNSKITTAEEQHLIDECYRSLVYPGADLVICDEGHRIKNSHASISKVLKQIRTRRRIVLTGYPLQNNMLEYWCMVDFVRPNYLGSKSEFSNMFEQPIKNGRCIDSTAQDIELMRHRVHVLHSLLKGFVQRRSHAVLASTLPSKQEYVLLVRMTPLQRQLYDTFMNQVVRSKYVANPIKAFTVCCKIWNHPDVLYNFLQKRTIDEVVDLDIEEVTRSRQPVNVNKKSVNNQQFFNEGPKIDNNSIPYDWAYALMRGYQVGIIENCAKMRLFYTILGESLQIGDRLLLFSQSLLTLDLIEEYLKRTTIPCLGRSWTKNRDFYRLDGQTSALEREKLINDFNRNPRVFLFLVSTRAGCLGINLIGANRVIIFDTSWNPCHDSQAVCRIYRYGQTKQCYIYRFVMDCCLEKKIYDRQINKQGLSDRVLDECNPEAYLSSHQLTSLCYDDGIEPEPRNYRHMMYTFNDNVMDIVLEQHSELLTREPFKHDSLLANSDERKLTRAEKKLAEINYQKAKRAVRGVSSGETSTNSVYGGLTYGPSVAYNQLQSGGNLMLNNTTIPKLHSQSNKFSPEPQFWHSQNVATLEIILNRDVPVIGGKGELEIVKTGERVLCLKSPKGVFFQLLSGRVVPLPSQMTLEESDYTVVEPVNYDRPQTSSSQYYQPHFSFLPQQQYYRRPPDQYSYSNRMSESDNLIVINDD